MTCALTCELLLSLEVASLRAFTDKEEVGLQKMLDKLGMEELVILVNNIPNGIHNYRYVDWMHQGLRNRAI